MKVEFATAYRRSHPLRLRERLIAYLPRYAALLARLAPLANFAQSLPLRDRAGFTSRRPLPRWRTDFWRDDESLPAGNGREVALFVDTFNRYFEPENARAAVRVLAAAGYKVHTLAAPASERPLCCGRTFLTAGLAEEAKREAERLIGAASPFLARGVPIVGLEPSCTFALRDEFAGLFPQHAEALRQHSFLFEEFLAAEADGGRLDLKLNGRAGEAMVHGHCHQKAFDAMPAVERVLRLVPELNVRAIESSCCGMAGSFGYEAEHYEISMRMGEASLLPAVRAASPEAIVVADGTSCREQIRHGTERRAVHVARVLEQAL